MKRALAAIAAEAPALLRNTHISLALQGWPAAVAVSVVAISAVAIAAIQSEREVVPE